MVYNNAFLMACMQTQQHVDIFGKVSVDLREKHSTYDQSKFLTNWKTKQIFSKIVQKSAIICTFQDLYNTKSCYSLPKFL